MGRLCGEVEVEVKLCGEVEGLQKLKKLEVYALSVCSCISNGLNDIAHAQ